MTFLGRLRSTEPVLYPGPSHIPCTSPALPLHFPCTNQNLTNVNHAIRRLHKLGAGAGVDKTCSKHTVTYSDTDRP